MIRAFCRHCGEDITTCLDVVTAAGTVRGEGWAYVPCALVDGALKAGQPGQPEETYDLELDSEDLYQCPLCSGESHTLDALIDVRDVVELSDPTRTHNEGQLLLDTEASTQ